ncbi:family 10 glycosylhydrolase [Nonomuraea sp. NPDC049152]|uniref:family 10 glycosylhydrolase n=1 Tax=Nonomuraea sp. NPDC049152 TaxID=3154350 RepID=UPI0033E4A31F
MPSVTRLVALLALVLTFLVTPVAPSSAAAAACVPDPATPKRQFRAMWISSVANIDWPSRTGLSVSAQQAEFRSWLDLAVQKRMNAVVVQVRPTADAFWPSPYEPWSQWLTGVQGGNPGYDPLAFMVAEAHARNLEFHAWFNPYRVANHDDPSKLVASHPARQNPSWRFAYGGKLYYNPGIPTVRDFIEDAIMDAVTRYDVDGVHLDDYFYPYPVSGQSIPDAATFAQYGGGFSNVADWRRGNIDLLVRELGQRIHAAKAHVAFGISPFGIWRNSSTDPLGSRTSGLQSYDAIYADSRRWVKQGWIDYLTPQLYWHIGFAAADYAVLTAWWSEVVRGTNVQLYAGQAAYRAGASGQDPAWQDPAELSDHLLDNRKHPEVLGDVYFSAKDVRADRIGSFSKVVADHYRKPALIPPRGTVPAPPPPANVTTAQVPGGVKVSWQGSAASYAVYRGDLADPCLLTDARNLIGTTRGTSFTDTSPGPGGYHVTALGRTHQESGGGSGGSFSVVVDGPEAGAAWGSSTYSTQRYGADYRFADPVAASDPAWFRTTLPSAGSYRVEVWYPANAGYNGATPHIVAAAGGNQTVTVDQRTGGGQWRSLGTFTLNAGTYNVVGVSRWTSATGYVIADAVRITADG